jgi:cytochrome c-type biogenesis protein CcmH/NrfF
VRRLAALALLLALALPGSAAAACQQTTVADLEDEVMCPVCGTSLATAGDAPLAVQQRRLIDGLVKQCKSKDEIKDALVAQYGESVLAEPDDEGTRIATYLVPALAFLAGLVAIVVATRRWRGRRRRDAATDGAAPPLDTSRLDEDMARYDL